MPNPLDPLLDFGVDLSDVVTRIEGLGYFVSVRDIQAATQAIQDEIVLPPAAFVSVANETAEANRLIGGHRQRVNVTLSVIFAEQVQRAAGDTRDTVELVRKALMRQLVGWKPRNAEAALEYDRYLLRGMTDNVIWCEVLFRTSYAYTVATA